MPIPRLLEGVGGTVDVGLIEVSADQHQAYRQAIAQTAREGHGRVTGYIELAGIVDAAESMLHQFVDARLRE